MTNQAVTKDQIEALIERVNAIDSSVAMIDLFRADEPDDQKLSLEHRTKALEELKHLRDELQQMAGIGPAGV